jgi:ribosomal protein S24E
MQGRRECIGVSKIHASFGRGRKNTYAMIHEKIVTMKNAFVG